jgi:hypothetical protein
VCGARRSTVSRQRFCAWRSRSFWACRQATPSRVVFVGATAYRLLVLLTRAFPVAILVLPLTVGFIRLGLYDTPLGVSLMHTALALPFAVLVSASLFQAIPRELEEAAWVFGCSPVRAFLRVVLPLALPGIAAIAIFAVLLHIELTATPREGEAGDRLDRCNAFPSMVIGGEYPLAANRRDRVRKARDELASLLGDR